MKFYSKKKILKQTKQLPFFIKFYKLKKKKTKDIKRKFYDIVNKKYYRCGYFNWKKWLQPYKRRSKINRIKIRKNFFHLKNKKIVKKIKYLKLLKKNKNFEKIVKKIKYLHFLKTKYLIRDIIFAYILKKKINLSDKFKSKKKNKFKKEIRIFKRSKRFRKFRRLKQIIKKKKFLFIKKKKKVLQNN